MASMTTVLPNLQQITHCHLGHGHKFSDGDDPVEYRAADLANWTAHDINFISNFRKLRSLKFFSAPLNGRYQFLFHSPSPQSLNISHCFFLYWDLEMLAGLPLLKDLHCYYNYYSLTGNISTLRVLTDTLTTVVISICYSVEGNFMDLADFPHLKLLNLRFTAVTGDIREISESDFSAMESLSLPSGVYGGMGYEFQLISDGPDVINTLYCIKKQRPNLLEDWYGELSGDSPDWY